MPDELTSSAYGSAQTWYPETSGYFILTVRDNAGGRTGRYRIDCNIGERHSNGINYRIYYKMYLIGGDELGITLEDREYYTRHDNATSEIGAREYHLPVTFRLPELGHHFESHLGHLPGHHHHGVYSLALNVCRLIWDSTLPSKDKDGRLEFVDFTEDEFRMNCIFERFLMNFCKQHCREEYPEVHREYIDFQLSPFGMMFKEAGEALPMMETDVTLFNPDTQEKHILDAKFYREALVSKFGGREKVRREHLSQILSYVMNQEDRSKPHTLNACGTLVYPTVDEDFDFSYRYKEGGHRIFVRTVNLGQPWRKIEERVKEIVKGGRR